MALIFVRILVMARLFTTQSFGYFSAGLMVSGTFGMLSSFGMMLVLQREMPMLIVRNRQRAGVILLVQCILLTCVSALVCVVWVWSGIQIAGLTTDVFLVAVLHGFSQQVFQIATVESKSHGQSVRYSLQNFMRGIALLTIGTTVCYTTASPFYTLLAEAVSTLIIVQGVLFAIFKKISNQAQTIIRMAIKRLTCLHWKSAIMLYIISLINYALLNLDRWLAAQSQSVESFALYAFMGTILLIGQSAQAVVNASAYPHLARRYASSNLKNTYQLCFQISCGLLIGCAILGIPACWLLNEGIQRWFPNYQAGLVLIPIFIAVAILRIADFWTSFLVITGLEKRLLSINIFAVISASIFWLYWLKPWHRSGITLLEIGLLTVMLTLVNYILVALAAWQSSKKIR